MCLGFLWRLFWCGDAHSSYRPLIGCSFELPSGVVICRRRCNCRRMSIQTTHFELLVVANRVAVGDSFVVYCTCRPVSSGEGSVVKMVFVQMGSSVCCDFPPLAFPGCPYLPGLPVLVQIFLPFVPSSRFAEVCFAMFAP